MPELKTPPIASGVTAEVYEWKKGQVLKLFRWRHPNNVIELSTTQVASANLPVPAVIDGLIEVDGREGFVLERINGPTMTEYVLNHPDSAVECARQMAHLHAEMHIVDVSGSLEFDRHFNLKRNISQADDLPQDIREAALEILDRLPHGNALYHGDYHPANIIMAKDGPVVIDWGTGARGNPLADYAMTWLLFRFFPIFHSDPNQITNQFWQTYKSCYCEFRSFSEDELFNWQIVQATAKLSFGLRSKAYPSERCNTLLNFVQSGLKGEPIVEW